MSLYIDDSHCLIVHILFFVFFNAKICSFAHDKPQTQTKIWHWNCIIELSNVTHSTWMSFNVTKRPHRISSLALNDIDKWSKLTTLKHHFWGVHCQKLVQRRSLVLSRYQKPNRLKPLALWNSGVTYIHTSYHTSALLNKSNNHIFRFNLLKTSKIIEWGQMMSNQVCVGRSFRW